MLPLQQIHPKNARSKRVLAKREPQQKENSKTALFLRFTTSSSLLNALATDLYTLKRPHALRFVKGNSIHPFDDPSSLEFFSQRNDTSQIVFASHSKKRPHSLTWIRCFGGKVLDMLELHVLQETARCISQFKTAKCPVGVKPMLAFSGMAFDDPNRVEYQLAKNLFTDFFRGSEASEIEVEGLQLLISFSVKEESAQGHKPHIHMRCYRLLTKRSATQFPLIETQEIGPRIDFRVGRIREANAAVMKEALKDAASTEARRKKNVETDLVGDKVGRIHVGRQDLHRLQTRKMKGLKRHRSPRIGLDNSSDIDSGSAHESSDRAQREVIEKKIKVSS